MQVSPLKTIVKYLAHSCSFLMPHLWRRNQIHSVNHVFVITPFVYVFIYESMCVCIDLSSIRQSNPSIHLSLSVAQWHQPQISVCSSSKGETSVPPPRLAFPISSLISSPCLFHLAWHIVTVISQCRAWDSGCYSNCQFWRGLGLTPD